LPITWLESSTFVITGQCPDQFASVSIYNIIYRFNINSRKSDGHYRSSIEYLNECY